MNDLDAPDDLEVALDHHRLDVVLPVPREFTLPWMATALTTLAGCWILATTGTPWVLAAVIGVAILLRDRRRSTLSVDPHTVTLTRFELGRQTVHQRNLADIREVCQADGRLILAGDAPLHIEGLDRKTLDWLEGWLSMARARSEVAEPAMPDPAPPPELARLLQRPTDPEAR